MHAANGLTAAEAAALMFISESAYKDHLKRAGQRLGAHGKRSSRNAVAIAFRRCLIDCDEITGGPISLTDIRRYDVDRMILSYRARSRYLKPPLESFEELRGRAARLAAEYRARNSI